MIIPASHILQQELIRVGRVHYHGGFAEVSNGEYLGRPVAIKSLKIGDGDSNRAFRVPLINFLACHHYLAFTQRLCREIIGWKYLFHPNISPLLGVSVSTDPHCFCILSEWMSNGNVMQYTRSNPEANRLRLVSPFVVSPRFLPLHTFSSLRSRLVWPTFTSSGLFMGISKV